MKRKPIALVSGGAGFIGSHMVDLLLDSGYRVRVLDSLVTGKLANLKQNSENSALEFEECDLRNTPADSKFFKGVKYIFHFAGIGEIIPSIEHPQDYMDVNIQGTVHLLEAARHAGVHKFVYAASSSCYGLAETPTREDHPIDPQYPYALSKYLGETACFHWGKVYKTPVNSVRIFNAYGTRQRTSGTYGAVFGVFLRQKLAKAPFTVVGDGTQTRDFLHVRDVTRAFLAVAENGAPGRVFNLGSGQPHSINYLVELLRGEAEFIPKRPGEPDCTWADITRITNETGWRRLVSFEDGVAEVVSNIDYWNDAPLWNSASIHLATQAWFNHMQKVG